ncbi:RICIN domain-containing protein [Enterococcus sp. AZ126]|uniref:RICIN domain-containing protein n=1 Tax=Enterococcus sp. AZ126 TaxID=2774635 RepID=UPI003F255528
MSMKKILFIFEILSFIFFCFYFATPASAEKVISDDLYVAYPKVNETLAVDINQNNTSPNYESLITYAAHGKGNQLLGYEYRPEKDGYIIYSGNDTQKIIGSTEGNTAKITVFTVPINSYTEFTDDYIWDIIQTEGIYYKIRNRKTATYLTVSKPLNDALITLSPDNGGDAQKFNLKTMNGVYKIRSVATNSYGWDVSGGVGVDREIITYPLGPDQSNQQWMILFKPSDNAYTISNYKQKNLIVSQEIQSNPPKVIKNEASFETPLGNKNTFDFQLIGNTPTGQSIVRIKNSNFNYYYSKNNITSGISPLSLVYLNKKDTKQQWILDKVRDIPKPEIKNLNISSVYPHSESFFYVGEELTVTGDFKGPGYNTYNLYSVFNTDEPVLNQKGIAIDKLGDSTFSSKIDTSQFKEGTFYIEIYARADSMFQSNKVNEKYKLVYPTPTGEAVPQTIKKGTPINTLKPSDFVKNLHDEMGNVVTATKIEGINTNEFGPQEAKVTIMNKYKTEIITVPVTVIGAERNVTVKFQKGEDPSIQLYADASVKRRIGEKIDLLDDPEIASIINQVENVEGEKRDYSLGNRTEVENYVVKDQISQEIIVRFVGNLTIDSIPNTFQFKGRYLGKERMQIIPLIATADTILTIHDSRAEGQGNFSVKAKLEKDIFNVLDPSYTIKDGYIKFANHLKINSKDFSTVAESNGTKDPKQYLYNFTLGKIANLDTNIKLVIPKDSMDKVGNYTGTILWEIENGP